MVVQAFSDLHVGQLLFSFGRDENKQPFLWKSQIAAIESSPSRNASQIRKTITERFLNFTLKDSHGNTIHEQKIRGTAKLKCCHTSPQSAINSGIEDVLSRINVTQFGSDTPEDRLLREIFYGKGPAHITASMIEDVISDLHSILKAFAEAKEYETPTN